MYFFKKAIWVVPVFSLGLTACGGDDDNTSASVPGNTNSLPLPGAPVLAQPTVGALTGDAYPVTFNWSSAANATGYTLCRKDASQDDNCAKQGETTTNTSLTLPLSLDTPADYFVLAKNSTGKTASTEIAVSLPKPEMPVLARPQVGAFNDSSSSYPVTFDWDSAKYATHYTLCREDGSEDDNCQFLLETEANNTSLTANLNLDEPANYFVLASNGTGKTASGKQVLSPAPSATNLAAPTVGELQDGYHPVTFTWDSAEHATGYTLCRKNDALDDDCEKLGETNELSLTLSLGPLKNHLADFFVLAENSTFKTKSGYQSLTSPDLTTLINYIKASNTGSGDEFGYSVSVSGDGNTLAVGARNEDSSSREINSGEDLNGRSNAGAVYVYRFANGSWSQQAYIKASNADVSDWFGNSVSLSGDGNILAVGAYQEDSNADGTDVTGAENSGAAYVYRFDGSNWTEQAFIKAENAGAGDSFGHSLSLSGDGKTLAVGAWSEDSNFEGTSPNGHGSSGAAYVYRFENDEWKHEAFIKAENAGSGDSFGYSVSLSSNGNTLAVGAQAEKSDSKEINSGEDNDSASNAGAAYVYRFENDEWTQQAYIKASNADAGDYFGTSVSVSGDGNTLAVGAPYEDSSSQTIDSGEDLNDAELAGAAYVYRFANGSWSQQAYIKASNADVRDWFGQSVSLSGDGNILAVGAWSEDSNYKEINSSESDNSATDAGAAYVYRFADDKWSQQAYIKASNAESLDYFGWSVSVSEDGNTLAVGAYGEDSTATGINGEGSNGSYNKYGAVYIY
ncbi:FG-GAP repeat protein [Grimontia sp. NTOU-MAR1]|uniref:FG-GAP repeat protein n=1 Tax=Grimontia sp. NTOU-MAR1 TaxID=3111011 RepID=UPI002DBB501E|nr:FG-GAP repeat protein [Grimontia sp. NTOU-MAR1]WRW00769.1 FG-GAP repeat protein [Grimontia sp. NTOU-MAR1]